MAVVNIVAVFLVRIASTLLHTLQCNPHEKQQYEEKIT